MSTELIFTYDATRFLAVEKRLGRSLTAIVAELSSEDGASLTTLVTLAAAGRLGRNVDTPYMADLYLEIEMNAARKLVEQHGIPAVATAVGKGMREALDKLSVGA